METTSDINNFMNQPSVVDKDFYNDVIVKNLNLFKEVEDLVYKRLDKELKFEKKSKKKSEELEKIREKYEKETDDLQKKIQEEKIKRLKQEKSTFLCDGLRPSMIWGSDRMLSALLKWISSLFTKLV
jgi:hypothetical protein